MWHGYGSMADRQCTGHQKVALEVDFAKEQLKGYTEIQINPTDPTLKQIRLNARQCNIVRCSVGNKAAHFKYNDVYSKIKMHDTSTVHQHGMFRKKIEGVLHDPPDFELIINIPQKIKIEATDSTNPAVSNVAANRTTTGATPDAGGISTPAPLPTAKPEIMPMFNALVLKIEYDIENIRDGFTFVGCNFGDMRYPHAYTTNSPLPGAACCLFPTLDGIHERWTWEIEVTVPQTIGDIFKTVESVNAANHKKGKGINRTHGDPEDTVLVDSDAVDDGDHQEDDDLDFVVVCSADMVDELENHPTEPWKKVFKFLQPQPISPQHVSFAVGPFEQVSLSEFRDAENEEAMGTMSVEVRAFCLPGREPELKNTCMFLPKGIDHLVREFGQYVFADYKLCFVDDLTIDTVETASLSICSSRLLFPETMIDPIWPVTRALTYSLAAQWAGIQVVPKDWADIWVIVGMAYWMTGEFLKSLMGNNEYRFRLKRAAEKICELDIHRPSLYAQGFQIPIEPERLEFIKLKAPVVLTILEKRLWKLCSSMVLHRVVRKTFLSAVAGELKNGLMSTAHFIRLCEKNSHNKLDSFFQQWVYGNGYPQFEISQRFNKKRMIVEMGIRQVSQNSPIQRDMTPEDFWNDASDHQRHVVIGPSQVFTGPMTIRIHEADGTPYEHVVDLKEGYTKLDIPYNTKYKRLKRTRRQKERLAAGQGVDVSMEAQQNDDVLLYCLGDVLQGEDDVDDWRLVDWTKEDEEKMAQESFEWIRMDADFEWICTLNIGQPDYMFLSQLQQDRDVIAQYDSIRHFANVRESALISSILVRTVMDRRYYYGIRVEAAKALARCATADLEWLGQFHLMKAFQEFFCFPDSNIPRGNDFSDFTAYYIQKAIPSAISQVRNISGDCPPNVKRWLIDVLRYNDNTNNNFDDSYYIANLMSSISNTLTPNERKNEDHFGFDDQFEDAEGQDAHDLALSEIDRYKRMDAWKPSYRNIVSETAIVILRDLTLRGVLPLNFKALLPYLREGTLETIRTKAFDCMIDLGALHENPILLKYVCFTMGNDPSPYIRRHVQTTFAKGLGMMALGSKKPIAAAPQADPLALTIEDVPGDPVESAVVDLGRGLIETTIASLKKELQHNKVMKEALWQAMQSPYLGLLELRFILDICAMLYETKNSYVVVLKQKKHLSVQHLGKGKLVFKWAYGKPKPKPTPTPTPPPPPPPPAPKATKAQSATPAPVPRKIKLVTNPTGSAHRGSHVQNGVSKKSKDPKNAIRRTPSMSGSPSPSMGPPNAAPSAPAPNPGAPRKIILKIKNGGATL